MTDKEEAKAIKKFADKYKSTVSLVDSKGDHVLIDDNLEPILDEDGNFITYHPQKKVIH